MYYYIIISRPDRLKNDKYFPIGSPSRRGEVRGSPPAHPHQVHYEYIKKINTLLLHTWLLLFSYLFFFAIAYMFMCIDIADTMNILTT